MFSLIANATRVDNDDDDKSNDDDDNVEAVYDDNDNVEADYDDDDNVESDYDDDDDNDDNLSKRSKLTLYKNPPRGSEEGTRQVPQKMVKVPQHKIYLNIIKVIVKIFLNIIKVIAKICLNMGRVIVKLWLELHSDCETTPLTH